MTSGNRAVGEQAADFMCSEGMLPEVETEFTAVPCDG